METFDALHAFRSFRASFYESLNRRADALFKLTDALLLCTETVPSPSTSASRRPIVVDGAASTLLWRTEEQMPKPCATCCYPTTRSPVARNNLSTAMDVIVRPRCDAESSPERGFYYHPSRHSSGQPIAAGWAYQFIARLN